MPYRHILIGIYQKITITWLYEFILNCPTILNNASYIAKINWDMCGFMTPQKYIISASVTALFVIVGIYTLYSFQQKVSSVNNSYLLLEKETSQANIYDSSRCLSPELVSQSLVSISGLDKHFALPFLASERSTTLQEKSLQLLIERGIDCQLAQEENRLLAWPLSKVSADQNTSFSATAEQLAAFIQAFTDFENIIEERLSLIDEKDNALRSARFNALTLHLYDNQIGQSLSDRSIVLGKEIPLFKTKETFARKISEHIKLSIELIDSQLKQQLLAGVAWLDQLQESTITSADINHLSSWVYWLDELPRSCKSAIASLTPLLKIASTSPLLLSSHRVPSASANAGLGVDVFSTRQRAISDCPATVVNIVNNIDGELLKAPLLLTVRGVNSGLVSPEWLDLAESLRALSTQQFMVHSAIIEKSPAAFSCRKTTTEWDYQAAEVMNKYIQGAIGYLARKDQITKNILNNSVVKNIITDKITPLINALGNTAQQNLFITPSANLIGKMNEAAKKSTQFSRFSPLFTSALERAKAFNIYGELTELERCVTEYAKNQFAQLVKFESIANVLTPILAVDDSNTAFSFSGLDKFEEWWESQQQQLTTILAYNRPYIEFIQNSNVSNQPLQAAINKWNSSQEEITAYQNAEDENQVSQLYSLYKKTVMVNKAQCADIKENILSNTSSLGNDIFSQNRARHIQRLTNFCR
jgi:hypothetical protein